MEYLQELRAVRDKFRKQVPASPQIASCGEHSAATETPEQPQSEGRYQTILDPPLRSSIGRNTPFHSPALLMSPPMDHRTGNEAAPVQPPPRLSRTTHVQSLSGAPLQSQMATARETPDAVPPPQLTPSTANHQMSDSSHVSTFSRSGMVRSTHGCAPDSRLNPRGVSIGLQDPSVIDACLVAAAGRQPPPRPRSPCASRRTSAHGAGKSSSQAVPSLSQSSPVVVPRPSQSSTYPSASSKGRAAGARGTATQSRLLAEETPQPSCLPAESCELIDTRAELSVVTAALVSLQSDADHQEPHDVQDAALIQSGAGTAELLAAAALSLAESASRALDVAERQVYIRSQSQSIDVGRALRSPREGPSLPTSPLRDTFNHSRKSAKSEVSPTRSLSAPPTPPPPSRSVPYPPNKTATASNWQHAARVAARQPRDDTVNSRMSPLIGHIDDISCVPVRAGDESSALGSLVSFLSAGGQGEVEDSFDRDGERSVQIPKGKENYISSAWAAPHLRADSADALRDPADEDIYSVDPQSRAVAKKNEADLECVLDYVHRPSPSLPIDDVSPKDRPGISERFVDVVSPKRISSTPTQRAARNTSASSPFISTDDFASTFQFKARLRPHRKMVEDTAWSGSAREILERSRSTTPSTRSRVGRITGPTVHPTKTTDPKSGFGVPSQRATRSPPNLSSECDIDSDGAPPPPHSRGPDISMISATSRAEMGDRLQSNGIVTHHSDRRDRSPPLDAPRTSAPLPQPPPIPPRMTHEDISDIPSSPAPLEDWGVDFNFAASQVRFCGPVGQAAVAILLMDTRSQDAEDVEIEALAQWAQDVVPCILDCIDALGQERAHATTLEEPQGWTAATHPLLFLVSVGDTCFLPLQAADRPVVSIIWPLSFDGQSTRASIDCGFGISRPRVPAVAPSVVRDVEAIIRECLGGAAICPVNFLAPAAEMEVVSEAVPPCLPVGALPQHVVWETGVLVATGSLGIAIYRSLPTVADSITATARSSLPLLVIPWSSLKSVACAAPRPATAFGCGGMKYGCPECSQYSLPQSGQNGGTVFLDVSLDRCAGSLPALQIPYFSGKAIYAILPTDSGDNSGYHAPHASAATLQWALSNLRNLTIS